MTTPLQTTQFKDRNGKIWDTAIDLNNARRVDSSDFSIYTDLKFSLLRGNEKAFITEILSNIELMFAIIYVLCADQVEKNLGVPPSDEAQELFAKSMGGAEIETGRDAFVEALGDFFPAGKTALSGLNNQFKKLQAEASKRMESLAPKMDQAMNRELDRLMNNCEKELEQSFEKTGVL